MNTRFEICKTVAVIVAWAGLLATPLAARCQDLGAATSGQSFSAPRRYERSDRLLPAADEPNVPNETDAEPVATALIRLGTTRSDVDRLLGTPLMVSFISSLRQTKATYYGETTIIFVENRALSVTPGGNTIFDEAGVFAVTREGRKVELDPHVLRQCGQVVPDDEYKCKVEESFIFTPMRPIPKLYPDFRRVAPDAAWAYPYPLHATRYMPLRLIPPRKAPPAFPNVYRGGPSYVGPTYLPWGAWPRNP